MHLPVLINLFPVLITFSFACRPPTMVTEKLEVSLMLTGGSYRSFTVELDVVVNSMVPVVVSLNLLH